MGAYNTKAGRTLPGMKMGAVKDVGAAARVHVKHNEDWRTQVKEAGYNRDMASIIHTQVKTITEQKLDAISEQECEDRLARYSELGDIGCDETLPDANNEEAASENTAQMELLEEEDIKEGLIDVKGVSFE